MRRIVAYSPPPRNTLITDWFQKSYVAFARASGSSGFKPLWGCRHFPGFRPSPRGLSSATAVNRSFHSQALPGPSIQMFCFRARASSCPWRPGVFEELPWRFTSTRSSACRDHPLRFSTITTFSASLAGRFSVRPDSSRGCESSGDGSKFEPCDASPSHTSIIHRVWIRPSASFPSAASARSG